MQDLKLEKEGYHVLVRFRARKINLIIFYFS